MKIQNIEKMVVIEKTQYRKYYNSRLNTVIRLDLHNGHNINVTIH